MSGKPKVVRRVEVTWRDSINQGGWDSAAAVRKHGITPTTCVTTGYLLEKDRERVVLAQSLSEQTNEVGNLVAIPRFAVMSIRRLRLS